MIVGLDIGTSKVVAIVGEVDPSGQIEIVGIGSHPSKGMKKGVVVNIESTVQSIQRAVEEAELMAGCQIHSVYVGIAGSHVRSLNSHGIVAIRDQEVAPADVEQVLDAAKAVAIPADQKVLHILPQEYVIDNQEGIREPLGMSGVRLEAKVHLVTCAVNAAQNIEKCIRRCGLEVEEVILEQLASSHAVLTDDERELGVCIVDIGGGTTDIAIFQDGIIRHTAVIPFGGNVISDDIRQGCQIMKKQAEQLKKKFGSALSQETKPNEIVCIPGLTGRKPKEIALKTLAQIIEARMTEIIEHVHYEIRSSGFGDQLIGGIVLTGGGSQLKHVTQLFQFVTGLDCRLGFPAEHIASAPEDTSIPSYSTGVGLVIKGYDHKWNTSDNESSTSNAKPVIDFGSNFMKSIKNWFETDDAT